MTDKKVDHTAHDNKLHNLELNEEEATIEKSDEEDEADETDEDEESDEDDEDDDADDKED